MTRFTRFKGHYNTTTTKIKNHIPKMRDIKNLDEKMLDERRYTKHSVQHHHPDIHVGEKYPHQHLHQSRAPFHKKDIDMQFNIRTAILVPSTQHGSEKISNAEHQKRIEETRAFLAKKYGGYTSVNATGGYIDSNGKLVKEPVAEVVAYTNQKLFDEHKGEVEHFLAAKRGEWTQESIGYEYDKNAHLYYYKG